MKKQNEPRQTEMIGKQRKRDVKQKQLVNIESKTESKDDS